MKPEKTSHPPRQCGSHEADLMLSVINDAARAYQGHIPPDCWHEPYMSREYLLHEMNSGVNFWCCEQQGEVIGVMGIQPVQDVTLIRHAYVRTAARGKGTGSALLSHLKTMIMTPALVGTWEAATWAIRFYERHGFRLVAKDEKDRLLRRYWSITDRQTETSVVLADESWFRSQR